MKRCDEERAKAEKKVEKKAAIRRQEIARRANEARTNGSVAAVNVSPCDLEARAEAAAQREPWDNAMELMRELRSGWVHARMVKGK